MEEYCLIARNKDTNEVKTISLKESWYSKVVNPTFKRKNSLEAIDLVTTKFPSQEVMVEKMYEKGYLATLNVDLFIAKKIKNKNTQYIKYYELIYNPENKERIADLREIAYAFLAKQQDEKQALIDKVFNKLISKANSKKYFREMLFFGDTNVSKRITDNFSKSVSDYSLKYKNKNFYDNYSNIRNAIEALNRYDYLAQSSEDIYDSNIKYLNGFSAARKKIEPVLLEILDKDYIEGQYNLFTDYDYIQESNNDKASKVECDEKVAPLEASSTKEKDDAKEEFLLNIDIPDLSVTEKRQQIFKIFSELPFGFIALVKNKTKINPSFFSKEKAITSEKEFLEQLLPLSLVKDLTVYTAHKNEYQKCLDYFANTNLIEEEIRFDEQKITNFLKKTKDLDKVFLWSLIYKNYLSTLNDDKQSKRRL